MDSYITKLNARAIKAEQLTVTELVTSLKDKIWQ